MAGSIEAPTYRWPEEGDARVPYWIYTDDGIYRREIERIFEGPTWSYAALECELPNPGDYKRTTLGEKSVIIVRGRDGVIRGLLNQCAHRGTQVCQREAGNTGEFTCPYHQWSYDLEGKLQGLAFRRGVKGVGGMPDDFDAAAHGLKPVRAISSKPSVTGTIPSARA